ncbi:MAG: hypothetical protein M1834_004469 [Cirrosporium novae-zelandiae]|nr:MAG: hypothetical protein M1834_004469 [Cirrosporium novae-zelandiae]
MQAFRSFQELRVAQLFRLQAVHITPSQSLKTSIISPRVQKRLYHFQISSKLLARYPQSRLVRRFQSFHLRFSSSKSNPKPPNASEPSLSLTQRLRKLSREYGWSALGVYLALSALDFPFSFLAVRWLGTERIGHWEHIIIENVKEFIRWEKIKDMIKWPLGINTNLEQAEAQEGVGPGEVSNELVGVGYDHGVKEAEQRNMSDNASIWTQLALAYAIHKSFIFIRVPLTAAVTPKVVKVLRGWGWDIGKRRPKIKKDVK